MLVRERKRTLKRASRMRRRVAPWRINRTSIYRRTLLAARAPSRTQALNMIIRAKALRPHRTSYVGRAGFNCRRRMVHSKLDRTPDR